jgi:NAD-dependent dihydropyrimidine dehydrogenase PreA subunit
LAPSLRVLAGVLYRQVYLFWWNVYSIRDSVRRRDSLNVVGGLGVAAALGPAVSKAGAADPEIGFEAVLMDVSRCIGCRKCEEACAEANGLPPWAVSRTRVYSRCPGA